jgi:hypothetical protein
MTMKFLIAFGLMALLSFSLSLYLPWWVVAPACFTTAISLKLKPLQSFLAGFASISLLWAAMAWYLSVANDHVLAHRMSQVILNKDNPLLLVAVTGLIGGITAGLSAFSGALLRKAFLKDGQNVKPF